MIRYSFDLLPGVEVSLDAVTPDSSAEIVVTGDRAEVLAAIIAEQYGYYGHLIGDATTPLDLAIAMASPRLSVYRPILEEGQDILEAARQQIPQGAVS